MKIFEDLVNLKVSEACFDEVMSLVERYIDAEHDDKIEKAHDKRGEAYSDALDKVKSTEAGTEERKEAEGDLNKAYDKLQKFNKLYDNWKKKRKEQVEKFKKDMEGKHLSSKASQEAGSEHSNAQIDQHNRQKLEKIFQLAEGILASK